MRDYPGWTNRPATATGSIRGPAVDTPLQIDHLIAQASPDALATYLRGAELLVRIQQLQTAAARLAALQQERAFVQGQLRTLERHHPQAVAAALRSVPPTGSRAVAAHEPEQG